MGNVRQHIVEAAKVTYVHVQRHLHFSKRTMASFAARALARPTQQQQQQQPRLRLQRGAVGRVVRASAPRRVAARCEQVSLSIPKPLGLVLEESKEGTVVVAEIVASGNAAKTGAVKVCGNFEYTPYTSSTLKAKTSIMRFLSHT